VVSTSECEGGGREGIDGSWEGKIKCRSDDRDNGWSKGGVKNGNEGKFFVNDSGGGKYPEVDGGGDGVRWDGGIG
jgi:hypothetical protein